MTPTFKAFWRDIAKAIGLFAICMVILFFIDRYEKNNPPEPDFIKEHSEIPDSAGVYYIPPGKYSSLSDAMKHATRIPDNDSAAPASTKHEDSTGKHFIYGPTRDDLGDWKIDSSIKPIQKYKP